MRGGQSKPCLLTSLDFCCAFLVPRQDAGAGCKVTGVEGQFLFSFPTVVHKRQVDSKEFDGSVQLALGTSVLTERVSF